MSAKQEDFWLFAGKSHSSFFPPPSVQAMQGSVSGWVWAQHKEAAAQVHYTALQQVQG